MNKPPVTQCPTLPCIGYASDPLMRQIIELPVIPRAGNKPVTLFKNDKKRGKV